MGLFTRKLEPPKSRSPKPLDNLIKEIKTVFVDAIGVKPVVEEQENDFLITHELFLEIGGYKWEFLIFVKNPSEDDNTLVIAKLVTEIEKINMQAVHDLNEYFIVSKVVLSDSDNDERTILSLGTEFYGPHNDGSSAGLCFFPYIEITQKDFAVKFNKIIRKYRTGK